MNLTGLYVYKRIIIYWHIFHGSGFHHICNIKCRLDYRYSPQNIFNVKNFNPHKNPISLLNVPICTQGMQRTWWPEAGTIIVTGPYWWRLKKQDLWLDWLLYAVSSVFRVKKIPNFYSTEGANYVVFVLRFLLHWCFCVLILYSKPVPVWLSVYFLPLEQVSFVSIQAPAIRFAYH